MPGKTDYSATAYLNWLSGQTAVPALAARYMGLFQTVPTSDSGVTGATEVSTSGTGYVRAQWAGTATTSATTSTSSAVLTFTSVPTWLLDVTVGAVTFHPSAGCSVTDLTTPTAIAASTTILSATSTTLTMSANATGPGVGSGDTIVISACIPAANSSGSEPATTPATLTSNAIILFPQALGNWATIQGMGIFDAQSSGNCLGWDWMSNNAWKPFNCSSASPGVPSSAAHGYQNNDTVVVTAKDGGTLPTTGGTWVGTKTVANATTDTFTCGVNTTGTGTGMVRKVVLPIVSANSVFYVPVGSLIVTDA